MFTRIVTLSLATTALAFSAALAADKEKPTPDNTLGGSLVSVLDGKVTVLGMEGKRITTFTIGKELEVVCNGKKCDVKDLKKDDLVTVKYMKDGDNILWVTKIVVGNGKVK